MKTEGEINREGVVKAALTIERWCRERNSCDECDCPFADKKACWFFNLPYRWGLEAFLRTRGMKHEAK